MTPDVLLLSGLFLLALAAVAWAGDRLLDWRVPAPPRPDRRIPARERELLGDSWPEVAADYFADWGRRRQELHITRHETRAGRGDGSTLSTRHGGSHATQYGQ